MTKASRRIKENLLFWRKLGNSCSSRLHGAVTGKRTRCEWIERLQPGQKRHSVGCPADAVTQRLAYFMLWALLTPGSAWT